MLDAVDPHRKKFGLKTFAELRAPDGGEKENLLIQQKTETVDALSKIAQPCTGVPEVMYRAYRRARVQFLCRGGGGGSEQRAECGQYNLRRVTCSRGAWRDLWCTA